LPDDVAISWRIDEIATLGRNDLARNDALVVCAGGMPYRARGLAASDPYRGSPGY
jgi:hypothetical protein